MCLFHSRKSQWVLPSSLEADFFFLTIVFLMKPYKVTRTWSSKWCKHFCPCQIAPFPQHFWVQELATGLKQISALFKNCYQISSNPPQPDLGFSPVLPTFWYQASADMFIIMVRTYHIYLIWLFNMFKIHVIPIFLDLHFRKKIFEVWW